MKPTCTRPFSTRTSRTTPRSTSETTGCSGSGTSESASQTCWAGHHVAPRDGAAHHRHLVPQRGPLVDVLSRARTPLYQVVAWKVSAEDAPAKRRARPPRQAARRLPPGTAPRWPRGSAARPRAARPTSARACGGRPLPGRSSPTRPATCLVGRRLPEPLEPKLVRRLVEHATGDRPRPVRHEPQLDERCARVLAQARDRTRARRRRPPSSSYTARAWPISFWAMDESATSSSRNSTMPVHSESRQPRTSSSSASCRSSFTLLERHLLSAESSSRKRFGLSWLFRGKFTGQPRFALSE